MALAQILFDPPFESRIEVGHVQLLADLVLHLFERHTPALELAIELDDVHRTTYFERTADLALVQVRKSALELECQGAAGKGTELAAFGCRRPSRVLASRFGKAVLDGHPIGFLGGRAGRLDRRRIAIDGKWYEDVRNLHTFGKVELGTLLPMPLDLFGRDVHTRTNLTVYQSKSLHFLAHALEIVTPIDSQLIERR